MAIVVQVRVVAARTSRAKFHQPNKGALRFQLLPDAGGLHCSVRSHSLAAGVVTVSTMKPTSGSVAGTTMSGCNARGS